MKKHTTIAVLGGTGKSGPYLVKELLARGYNVKLLIRNRDKTPPSNENLKYVYGDVTDPNSIPALLKDADAIISNLGTGIPMSSKTIFGETTAQIIKALEGSNNFRYIMLTGLNVDTAADKKGEMTKAGTNFMYANFPISTQNRQDEYEMLRQSNLDWTLVRSSLIELTDESPDYATSTLDCGGQKISASSLAKFMVDQLESSEYIKKAPFIWNKS